MGLKCNRTMGILAWLLTVVLLFSGCIKVSAINPSDGSTGVARDTVIQVTFTTKAKASTVNSGTFLVEDSLGNPVSGTVTYSNKVATFTPLSELSKLSTYNVTLTTGIKNPFCLSLKANYTFRFTTCDGAWGTAGLIESNDGDAGFPQIVLDATGDAIAVWSQSDGSLYSIWAKHYIKGSGWGTPRLIEWDDDSNAYDPQIAVDADGHAIAVWWTDNPDGICSNYFVKGYGWGTAEMINTDTTGFAHYPQIAVDADGSAIAVWAQWDGTHVRVATNRYTKDSRWGTTEMIVTDYDEDANEPQIAIDADGNAFVVWYQGISDEYFNAWANRYTPGEGWGMAEMIDTFNPGNATSRKPQIAVDKEGNAIAVWHKYDGMGRIWTNRYTKGIGWGTAEHLAWSFSTLPQIAIDADGNAIVVQCGSYGDIYANRYTPSEGWGNTTEMINMDDSGTSSFPSFPQIDFDAYGNAIAIWHQFDGIRNNIWINRYTKDIGWGSAELIDTDDGDAQRPQIAIDADGNAIAVWHQSDGTRNNIWANLFE